MCGKTAKGCRRISIFRLMQPYEFYSLECCLLISMKKTFLKEIVPFQVFSGMEIHLSQGSIFCFPFPDKNKITTFLGSSSDCPFA
jgi:hypothetical protein